MLKIFSLTDRPGVSVTATHRLTLLLFLSTLAMPLSAQDSEPAAKDPRLTHSSTSPQWLRAIGKLRVPGIKYEQGRRSNNLEDCSATLVRGTASASANTIITAWHCLEFYRDLSKEITFTLLPESGESIASEAIRLADGGGMHADWAILRLLEAVPGERVQALTVSADRADPARQVAMAGFSRDSGIGHNGDRLSYDPACTITRQQMRSSDTDCTAHKGASGGAVVQVSAQGVAHLSGVISQGDGAGISTFIPVTGFRTAISRFVR